MSYWKLQGPLKQRAAPLETKSQIEIRSKGNYPMEFPLQKYTRIGSSAADRLRTLKSWQYFEENKIKKA